MDTWAQTDSHPINPENQFKIPTGSGGHKIYLLQFCGHRFSGTRKSRPIPFPPIKELPQINQAKALSWIFIISRNSQSPKEKKWFPFPPQSSVANGRSKVPARVVEPASHMEFSQGLATSQLKYHLHETPDAALLFAPPSRLSKITKLFVVKRWRWKNPTGIYLDVSNRPLWPEGGY